MCVNCDEVAHNLIQKLKDMGKKIPEDYSVVGFDNDIFAEITNPKLTTIAVDIEEMAKTSTHFIIEKMKNNQKKFGRVTIKGNIIYRDSVGEIKAR